MMANDGKIDDLMSSRSVEPTDDARPNSDIASDSTQDRFPHVDDILERLTVNTKAAEKK